MPRNGKRTVTAILRSEQIMMDQLNVSKTLPKVIHVKRHDPTGSLVTTPVPSPRRLGNGPLAPVEIDSPSQNNPTREIFIPVETGDESIPVKGDPLKKEEVEEGLVRDEKPPGEQIRCPFEEMGCGKMGRPREVKLHIRDDREYHSVLMCRNITKLGKSSQVSYKQIYNQHCRNGIALEHADAVVGKYDAQYVFKISDIGKKMYAAYKQPKKPHLIYSDLFESHRYGYKMCTIVAPFGDGSARRQYISAFVSLIKGDYDAILEWPFRCPVTFALKKPGSQLKYEKTIDPAEQADPERFQRPQIGRNKAFGFQMFCPIDQLEELSIMDDIYLEIYVDLTKMAETKRKTGADY